MRSPKRKWTHALALAATLVLPLAAAHTAVTAVQPVTSAGQTAPSSVVLRFSESVNLRYSIFKVYPLPAGQSGQRTAAELTRRVIALRGDEAARADTYRPRPGQSEGVTLPLKSGLRPGQYAVMWRMMSADGHPVTGQALLTVPGTPPR